MKSRSAPWRSRPSIRSCRRGSASTTRLRQAGTVRPHQALGYLTPHEFLAQWQSQSKEAKCH